MTDNDGPISSFRLTSAAFRRDEPLPREHTCDGEDVSPPLDWTDPPEGTRSLALIVDDPDAPDPSAPTMVWTHWVVYRLPPDLRSLIAGASPRGLPEGAVEGLNGWKEPGWRGPCPPIGRHRYFHKLYALDVEITPSGPLTRAQLEQRMVGHVLAKAELVGTYARKRQPR
jgi:Raf kinase inhibitor-like YbhB/YbcL family protein